MLLLSYIILMYYFLFRFRLPPSERKILYSQYLERAKGSVLLHFLVQHHWNVVVIFSSDNSSDLAVEFSHSNSVSNRGFAFLFSFSE